MALQDDLGAINFEIEAVKSIDVFAGTSNLQSPNQNNQIIADNTLRKNQQLLILEARRAQIQTQINGRAETLPGEIISDTQDNTLRNVLLIGGLILLI